MTYPWASGDVLTASDLNAAIGVVQIVRATDTVNRSTTSGSFVDANISVTITPNSASNNIMIVWVAYVGQTNYGYLQITDSSNVAIAGAEGMGTGSFGSVSTLYDQLTTIGYDSPATTSPVTYKGRFRRNSGTAYIFNGSNTGQLFAIEVKP